MKARLSLLHKTESEWAKLSSFTPEAGEVIIYDSDDTYRYARVKIGDGKRLLKDIEFFTEAVAKAILEKHAHAEVLDSGRITEYF